MKYTINFNNGVRINLDANTVGDAQSYADNESSYTQQDISIEDEAGDIVAVRYWCGTTEGIEDESDPIVFGAYGYYGDWVEF